MLIETAQSQPEEAAELVRGLVHPTLSGAGVRSLCHARLSPTPERKAHHLTLSSWSGSSLAAPGEDTCGGQNRAPCQGCLIPGSCYPYSEMNFIDGMKWKVLRRGDDAGGSGWAQGSLGGNEAGRRVRRMRDAEGGVQPGRGSLEGAVLLALKRGAGP